MQANNLLSIRGSSRNKLESILVLAAKLKYQYPQKPVLNGQTWALLFSQPSTRTRVSFEMALRQLGAESIYLSFADTQWGRGELISDTARVLARMGINGAIIRTHSQRDIEHFAAFSQIPTINALSGEEHPCQILGDLLTLRELRGELAPLRICFIGDGSCNTATSWIWACGLFNFHLTLIAPKTYQPHGQWRAWENMVITDDLAAAEGADVLYTDTFVSMGSEKDEALRLADLGPYWISQDLFAKMKMGCLVMHPLPAHRGQEIHSQVMEENMKTILRQAENRLHVQRAILALPYYDA